MKMVKTLVHQWIDGIILVPSVSRADKKTEGYLKSLSRLKKKDINIPVVQLEVPCLNPYVDSVVVDHDELAYQAVMHLTKSEENTLPIYPCGGKFPHGGAEAERL